MNNDIKTESLKKRTKTMPAVTREYIEAVGQYLLEMNPSQEHEYNKNSKDKN